MQDAIPKSLNRAPVDFRPEKFLIIWYAFGGLADDFKIADNSINSTGVSAERAEIYTSSLIGDLVARFLHVGNKQRPVTGRHRPGC